MEQLKLVYTLYIRSNSEKTWDAITKPEITRRYWGGMANVSDWQVGSQWQHASQDAEILFQGEVMKYNYPEDLILTWASPLNIEDQSKVSLKIEEVDGMVCLTLIHSEFTTGSKIIEEVSEGWPRVLSSLKSFLETGEGLRVGCE